MKLIIIAIVFAVLLILGGKWLSDNPDTNQQVNGGGNETKVVAEEKNIPPEEIVSQGGVHLHPELTITVDGEKQDIPTNIGVGVQYADRPLFDSMMGMANMHTHDDSGTLHWEVMKGPVTKDDVRLKNFFAIWGKEITEFGTEVTMTVNGEENNKLGDYEVKDGDAIVLNYSK